MIKFLRTIRRVYWYLVCIRNWKQFYRRDDIPPELDDICAHWEIEMLTDNIPSSLRWLAKLV